MGSSGETTPGYHRTDHREEFVHRMETWRIGNLNGSSGLRERVWVGAKITNTGSDAIPVIQLVDAPQRAQTETTRNS